MSFGFDVGIVPLTTTNINRSKSWLKRLEYGACGIPSVASDLAEQRALLPWGLARKPIDWTRQLRLMLNHGYRIEMAHAARHAAEQNDVSIRGKEYVEVIESWASDFSDG